MHIPKGPLPTDLMTMAGPLYTKALWQKLVPVTGAQALLHFTFRYVREGFLVDLAPHVEPLLARRVSQVLAQPIDMTNAVPPQETMWLTAEQQGVSRDKFEEHYERTNKLFHETQVSGWDVVRFLALGGGLSASYLHEGMLTLQVSQAGLAFGLHALPAQLLANDLRIGQVAPGQPSGAAAADAEEPGPDDAADGEGSPDAPTFH